VSTALVALLAAGAEGLLDQNQDFGIPWGTLGVILGLVALLMLGIRLMGILAVRARDAEPSQGASARKAGVGAASQGAATNGTNGTSRTTVATVGQLGALPPSALANVERRTVVLIAAAVAAVEGPRVRILDIRRVQGGNISSQQAWSMEGRREIYL
jgi:hypothetical protein